jgi:membrane-associated phospholipid phosphatase
MNLDLRQLDRGPRWPGWRGLAPFLAWGSLVAVVFLAVYPASNWLGSRRAELWHFYLDTELAIPFVPQAVWLYLSMYLLFALPPWFVPADAAARLGKQLITGCVACGSIFLLLPAALGFDRMLPAEAPYRQIFQTLHAIDAPHNLVPSLHVVFSCLIALACAGYARTPYAWLLRIWLVAIVVSTVLVHQHHLIDVLVALLLVGALRAHWKVA